MTSFLVIDRSIPTELLRTLDESSFIHANHISMASGEAYCHFVVTGMEDEA